MDFGSPCFLTVAEAATQLRTRALSPVELTLSVLERIADTDDRVHAFATVQRDDALRAAVEAEAAIGRGEYRGALHGIPIALKDLYFTAGTPTEGGSQVLRGFVPTYDATVTRRLKEAGAVIVGKTVTHEFASGLSTPATRNPWDLERVPGGSSAGSGAAVAAHSCLAAMGSDTGGSIRMPAALNGVVGLKPTYGRVSKYGVIPLSWSLDHCGPMTRTVEDAALLLNAVAGHDHLDPTTVNEPVPDYTHTLHQNIRGLRIGVPRNYFFDGVHQPVKDAVAQALRLLESSGAILVEVEVPYVEFALRVGLGILVPEASSLHQSWLRSRAADYLEGTRTRLELGELLLATHYLRAQRARTIIKQTFREVFTANRLDILATPTEPTSATKIDETTITFDDIGKESYYSAFVRETIPFNVCGLPALSVPCGFSPDPAAPPMGAGLPIGLQIVGRPFDESTILRVGVAYQAMTDWHLRRPAL